MLEKRGEMCTPPPWGRQNLFGRRVSQAQLNAFHAQLQNGANEAASSYAHDIAARDNLVAEAMAACEAARKEVVTAQRRADEMLSRNGEALRAANARLTRLQQFILAKLGASQA